MANEKKVVKKPTTKLKKKEYVIKNQVTIGDKVYKKGDKISLTKEGYRSLRLKHKV